MIRAVVENDLVRQVFHRKERHTPLMNENEDPIDARTAESHETDSSQNVPEGPDSPSRRELMERYAKYAIVGAPLLLFASKAHAIHSKP